MNVVMTGAGKFVEIQRTAEGVPFSRGAMENLVGLTEKGIAELMTAQQVSLSL